MSKRPTWTRATTRTAEAGLVVAVAVFASLAACVPSDPDSTQRVAVRRAADGAVEVLPCTSHKVEDVTVVAVEDPGQEDRTEEVLWKLEFDPAKKVDSIELGEAPRGATQLEPWRGDLFVDRPDVRFAVRLWQDDGNNRAQSFTLADLDGDTVLFEDQAMTAAEFEDTDCSD